MSNQVVKIIVLIKMNDHFAFQGSINY